MIRPYVMVVGVLWLLIGTWLTPTDAAVEREKLLTESGVYGTFAVFALDDEWAKLEPAMRIARLSTLKGVVQQYREKATIDLYLLRGLSDHGDLMFRIHSGELRLTQDFLLDLLNSQFGRHLRRVGVMHGLTKKPNYAQGFSEQTKTELKANSDPGAKPYAIVIPIRKSPEWWALDQDKRAAMMQEHTDASLPYLKTVKRKLYHATGLDDLDFITYFETSKLDDFHSLVLSLEKVKEFHYTRRFGNPTLLGTVKSLDDIIETFAQ